MRDARSPPETIAAVDLGSNSFHLLVARPEAESIVFVDRMREMVQLARGLDDDKQIRAEAQQGAIECLKRFGQRIGHMPGDAVRAVGTNTLRSARNADAFLEAAESALGHPIETISGMEEARLIYLGVAHSVARRAERRLVVDIGGGSTELIVGEGFRPLQMESLYMGCVTISSAFFPTGEITARRWRKAELAALRELEPVRATFRAAGWQQAVGASGTVRAIDAVARAAGWVKSDGLSLKSLKRVRDAILAAGHVDRLDLDGLNPRRRAVFPGGVVVLLAIFDALGIERMRRSDGALREGLLYDLLGRMREEDVRARSVSALADRYHVDWKQAARVEHTALRLFDQVAVAWDLDERSLRPLLSWSARLHEIGLDIAHQHFHKHGEYIVAQSDLFGFTREEQRMLATLVRAHRRKLPTSEIKRVLRRRVRDVERLAVLLRLAALLHRSRAPDGLPEPELSVQKRSVELRFPDGWLDERPLTRADLDQEQSLLRAAGYRLEFR